MALLNGLRVAQIGRGLAAAVCGRLLADLGAEVICIEPDNEARLARYLDHGKPVSSSEPAGIDLLICEGSPAALRARGWHAAALRQRHPEAAIVLISPFGQSGPWAERPASDLTLCAASGIGRMLTGQVDDLAEPPLRPAGEQSAFIGGLAAACGGLFALFSSAAERVVDVSIQEALATLAITELARAGLAGREWRRRRDGDGNGATVCILPAADGFVAISPREEKQWRAWVTAMGDPDWAADARFVRKPQRIANWDALHALMSGWSRQHDKRRIAALAQAAHVPSFPLCGPGEHFQSAQLRHRRFFRRLDFGGRELEMPGAAFGPLPGAPSSARSIALRRSTPLPLSGLRVLDFSWVIAGPTVTRYLAALGADVIKIEAPGQGDPGRASELHTVLGQAKRSVVLDLKSAAGADAARALAARSDVLIENFASGVMDRLGLGAARLQADNPRLIYVSASGLGRSGPEAGAVAYGTLLQSYTGFAELNRHPDRAPRIGMAWLDPMCGLKIAAGIAAALWRRQRDGLAARLDVSMVEAMLWTMAEPLLAAQLDGPPQPRGNASSSHAPHGVFRCAGEDAWVAIAVSDDRQWRGLCGVVPELSARAGLDAAGRRAAARDIAASLAAWTAAQPAGTVAERLADAGVPAAAFASSLDLLHCPHLQQRGFWEALPHGSLPGLPWQAGFGRRRGSAPALGADTDQVLGEILGLSENELVGLRRAGAIA